uniref:Peroxisomal biogenesis factor 3 n=1 Tax=Lygus hesperus TaxID=30085 RepID=A0A0A9X500_LYGHE
MFSKLRGFISRHRRKFIVGGIVVGGAVLATTYAQRKLLEWQEKEAQEFFERIQRESHFKSTERNCNQTICSLSETLKDTILKLIDTEEVLRKIRAGEGNKIELWDDLKVLVFTQISTLLYAGLMLVIVLRVQLNVMGGYLFRFKMDSKDSDAAPSQECQESYLSLCNYFINQGVKDLCSIIDKHVHLVLKDVSLKEKMSLQDIEQVFWSIQSSLSQDPLDPLKHMSKYLLQPFPPQNFENKEGDFMKKIFYETTEILDSPEVVAVAESTIKRCYSNTVDRITTYYLPNNGTVCPLENGVKKPDHEEVFKNVTEITVPLAKVVPIIHGLAKSPSKNKQVDPWIEQYIIMEKINSMGANLYEAFSFPQVCK